MVTGLPLTSRLAIFNLLSHAVNTYRIEMTGNAKEILPIKYQVDIHNRKFTSYVVMELLKYSKMRHGSEIPDFMLRTFLRPH